MPSSMGSVADLAGTLLEQLLTSLFVGLAREAVLQIQRWFRPSTGSLTTEATEGRRRNAAEARATITGRTDGI